MADLSPIPMYTFPLHGIREQEEKHGESNDNNDEDDDDHEGMMLVHTELDTEEFTHFLYNGKMTRIQVQTSSPNGGDTIVYDISYNDEEDNNDTMQSYYTTPTLPSSLSSPPFSISSSLPSTPYSYPSSPSLVHNNNTHNNRYRERQRIRHHPHLLQQA